MGAESESFPNNIIVFPRSLHSSAAQPRKTTKMTIHGSHQRLTNAYNKLAIHQSQLNFIISCLDHGIIPRGLIVKKAPMVASVGFYEKTIYDLIKGSIQEREKLENSLQIR